MRQEEILGAVSRYYAGRLAEHGPVPRGVDWNGEESQRLRHEQFLRLFLGMPNASVLDLGCGYGDFLQFIRSAGHRGAFLGWDVAPEMIEAARRLHGEHENSSWHVGAEPDQTADFAVSSGVLNVRDTIPADVWEEHVRQVIDTLARSGRRGFGFNVLSLSSDAERRRPHLYYADPAQMLRYCLDRYGRHVALLQDYGLWEFTVLVRHG